MEIIYLIAFLPPIFYGLNCIIDEKLTGKHFKKISSIVFYSNITNLIFAPFLFFIHPFEIPTKEVFGLISIIAFLEVFYLFPYFKALKHIDTSIVASFFAITRILTPIVAYVFFNEKLNVAQYIGFFIIIFSSVLLSYNPKEKLKLNKAFFYMLIASFFTMSQATLYKITLQYINWVNLSFWLFVFAFLYVIPFLFFKDNRKDLKSFFSNSKTYKLFFLNEFVEFLASNFDLISLSLIPFVIAQGISSTQPLFVLIISFILSKFFKIKINESFEKKNVLKKILCFTFMIIGVIFIVIK